MNRREIIERLYSMSIEDRAVIIGFALVLLTMLDELQSESFDPESIALKTHTRLKELVYRESGPDDDEVTAIDVVFSIWDSSISSLSHS